MNLNACTLQLERLEAKLRSTKLESDAGNFAGEHIAIGVIGGRIGKQWVGKQHGALQLQTWKTKPRSNELESIAGNFEGERIANG